MIFRDYLEKLNAFAESNPKVLDLPIVAEFHSDEGNAAYKELQHEPVVAGWDGLDCYTMHGQDADARMCVFINH
jgi:hypothetical protein